MFAWMNEAALRRTLETGRMWYLEPEPPGVLVQGRDLGRPPVRARGPLRLRRRRAAVRRRAGGPGRVPHRRAQLLLPGVRRRRHARARLSPGRGRGGALARRVRRAGARPHRRPRVAGGARRPRDAGLGVREARGRRRGRPRRRSCSSRWSTPSGGAASPSSAATRRSRWSCAGARSSSTVRPRTACPPTSGALAALEALLAHLPGAHDRRSCRRSTAGSSATSATTSYARSSACPTSRPTTSGMPDAVLSVTGHVTAFDHFRQRLYLIENVFLDAAGGDHRRVRRLRRRVRAARRAGRRAGAARCPTCRRHRRRATSPSSRPYTSTMPADVYHAARWRRLGSTSSPATSSRWCSRSASTSTATSTRSTCTACCARSTRRRTCTSCGTPRRRWSARRRSRWCSCSTAGSSAVPSPGPAAGAAPRPTTGAWPPSSPSTRRSAPST